MTTLTVERENGAISALIVSGHAGFAQSGQDIVCAAVSVLITTGINALATVAGVISEVQQDEKTALISCCVPTELSKQAAHDAQVILRTVLQGFEDIAEAYPKHFKIIDGRKSSC